MTKFVTVKKCIRSIPPVAFVGEEVNVRREYNRYVVTNGEHGFSTVLTRTELDEHFDKLPTIGGMGL